jgi:hypothetical protein
MRYGGIWRMESQRGNPLGLLRARLQPCPTNYQTGDLKMQVEPYGYYFFLKKSLNFGVNKFCHSF